MPKDGKRGSCDLGKTVARCSYVVTMDIYFQLLTTLEDQTYGTACEALARARWRSAVPHMWPPRAAQTSLCINTLLSIFM